MAPWAMLVLPLRTSLFVVFSQGVLVPRIMIGYKRIQGPGDTEPLGSRKSVNSTSFLRSRLWRCPASEEWIFFGRL